MRVALHPEARAELRAAAIWFEEQRVGLGDEFVLEISSVFDRIAENPGQFSLWPSKVVLPKIRRAVLTRFPYVVAFEVDADHIAVLAVAHARRRPLYWLVRAL